MSTPDEQVKSIFLNAAEIATESERSAYLDERCGDDAELRHEIDGLLRHHKLIGTFLESSPIGAEAVDQTLTVQPGDTIGSYKLLQQIGEGGMGVVYMADQSEPVERRVALKIIKPGIDTRKVIARFEAERQALAMMDHPNIAKVLDAGATDSGRPYFVMELVTGVPVTQYCDEKQLTPRERLELFVPICQAIQHAHQKGIIHRDIKPSNVLVAEYDDRPVPKIIDFGVAKAIEQKLTEKTVFTEFGQVVGTVEYMSPEQAKLNQLDIDTRTDVYSLGVLLYELLTGETPFDRERLRSAAFDELLRIIREEEPPRPSLKLSTSESLPSIAANRHVEPKQLSATVHGELDWIVMKAMEKDRTRRYDTASKFAEDVQHYLSDEAVEAGPPSAAYRIRKFARRNKPVIVTTATIAAALIIGTSVATWQAIRALTAERLAEDRLRTVTKQKNDISAEKVRADAAMEDAKKEAAIARAVNDFLQRDLLEMVEADAQIAAKISPQPDITLRTVLDRAAKKIGERFTQQPIVEAAIRTTIGNAYRSIGAYAESEKHQRRALRLREQALGSEHVDTVASRNNLSNALFDQGRYKDAFQMDEENLEICRRVFGEEHPATLRSLHNLASGYQYQGNFTQAEKLYRQVVDVRRRVLGNEHPETFVSINNLAQVHRHQKRFDDALKLYQELLDLRRRALGESHPRTLDTMVSVAVVLQQQRRHEDAELHLRRALDRQKETLGREHPHTLQSMHNLAVFFSDAKRYSDADKLGREVLTARRRILGADHPDTLLTMSVLRHNLVRWGRYEDAIEMHQKMQAICHSDVMAGHPDLSNSDKGLLTSVINHSWRLATHADPEKRDSKEAVRLARFAIELESDVANHWDNLGVALYRNGEWDEAIESLEKAREMRDGNDRYHQFFLAMSYWQVGRYDEAVANYVQAAKWLANGQRAAEQYRFRDEAESLFLDSPEGIEMVLKAVSGEVEQRPNDRALRAVRAQLYAASQDWEQSADDWARVIDLTEDPRAWPSPRQDVCREIAEAPELFDHVAQLRPDEPAVWIGRGQYHVLRSQWVEAARDYARAAPLQPVADQTYQYAGLLLLVGDEQGYRKYCAELSAMADEPGFLLARSGAIGPESGVEPNRIVEWAEKGVTENKNAWELHVLGLAQYRAGRFDEAIQSLKASNAGNWPALAKAQNDLVLAMAYHDQGEKEKAEELLNQAKKTIDTARPQQPGQPVDAAVPDWIGIEALRREAEGIIELPGNAAEKPEQSESDELNVD